MYVYLQFNDSYFLKIIHAYVATSSYEKDEIENCLKDIDTVTGKEPPYYNQNDQGEVIQIGKEIDYLFAIVNK